MPNFYLSQHAFNRYRERIDRNATWALVNAAAARAEPAPGWLRKLVAAMDSYTVGTVPYVDGDAVFIVFSSDVAAPLGLTVLSLRAMEILRQKHTSKKPPAGRPRRTGLRPRGNSVKGGMFR